MKKINLIITMAFLVFTGLFACSSPTNTAPSNPNELSGTISVSGAWALYPMMVKWSEEFRKLHPKIKIDVAAGGAGKGLSDALAGIVDLGMVSREISPEEVTKGAWFVPVTKDAVVVTVNDQNPQLALLQKNGIKKDGFLKAWFGDGAKTWGHLMGTLDPTPLNVYTRSDACGAAQTWAAYFGKAQEDLKGTGVYGDPGVAEAVRKDVAGMGYNNINFAYDTRTSKPLVGIAVVPLDVNDNGTIDPEENFYGDLSTLVKAIADGKYPSPPARDLYLVAGGKPAKKEVTAFLTWILTDGQKYVTDSGYIILPEAKLKAAQMKVGGN